MEQHHGEDPSRGTTAEGGRRNNNGNGHNGHNNGNGHNGHVLVPLQSHDSERILDAQPSRPVAPAAAPLRTAGRPAPPVTISVVIPTWNEAANIGPVLRQLDRFDDIVIVDAFSQDATVASARAVRPDLRLIQRPPRGKGDALRAGFAAATGDIIVIMDADGSMDPGEIDVFISMMGVGFDLVKGSRLAVGGGSHDLTLVRTAGNAALCLLANKLFGTRWTDLCYGYLAFRRECLPHLALDADGFEIESQILAHAALAKLRIAEIPSIEMPRLTGESHLNARRDGTRILRAMLQARFTPHARRSAAALRPVLVPEGTAHEVEAELIRLGGDAAVVEVVGDLSTDQVFLQPAPASGSDAS